MKNPSQEKVQSLLALVAAGDPGRALPSILQFADAYPDSPTAHLFVGIVLAQQGNFDRAINSLQKALSLNPRELDAQNYLGFILLKQNRPDDAAKYYESALEIQRGNAKIEENLVACYEASATLASKQGNFAKAVANHRKMAALRPENASAHFLLAVSLCQAGDWKEAWTHASMSIHKSPDHVQFLARAAIIAKALGKPDQRLLDRILEISVAGLLDTSTKMWAALMSGDPELAFSFDLPGLNVMRWRDMSALYRRTDLPARLHALPAISGSFPHKNMRPLIYAGGDGVYAEKFATELIASALEKCPNCDFHLHLMNLGKFDPGKAFAEFPPDRLTWSIEEMGAVDKILYAPRRWLRLSQIQHYVERTIILVDTDSIINGDIVKVLPGQFDVVLYDRSDEPWIHQTVNGAFLAVTPRGRDFTDFLAAYILHFEDLGIPKWFDDQFNMVSARAWFQSNVPDVLIKYAPKSMMDWTGARHPGSLIWHAKGDLKKSLT